MTVRYRGEVMTRAIKQLQFEAEIKKVSSKKLASLDIEYQAVLSGTDPMIHTLGLLDAETRVKVTVEVIDG